MSGRGKKRNRRASKVLNHITKNSVVQKKLPKKSAVFVESRELASFVNPKLPRRKYFYRQMKVFYFPEMVFRRGRLRRVIDFRRSVQFYRRARFRCDKTIRYRFKRYRWVKLCLNYLVKKARSATLLVELGFLKNKITGKHFFKYIKAFYVTPKSAYAFFSLFKFFFIDGKLVFLKRPPTVFVHIFSFNDFSKVEYDQLSIHKYFWLYVISPLSKLFPISVRGVKNFKITIGTLATHFIKRWKKRGRSSFFFKWKSQKFKQKARFLNLENFDTGGYFGRPFQKIPKNFLGVNGIKNLNFFKRIVNKLYLFSLFLGKIDFKVLFSYIKFFQKLFKLNLTTFQFSTFFKALLYFSALSKVSVELIRFFFFLDFYINRAFLSMETVISPFIPMFAYNCAILRKFFVAVQRAIFLRKPYTKYYKREDDAERFVVFHQAFLKKKSALNFWFPRFNLKNGFFNKSFNLYSYLIADFVSFCFDKIKAENLLMNLLNTYEVNWVMKKIFHKRKPITVLSLVRRKKQRMRRTFKFLLETMKSNESTHSFLSRLPLEGSQVFSSNFTELSAIFLNRLYNLKKINVNTFYLTLSTLGPSQRRRSSIKWQ
jgi:hypothetical protein